ncbi:MAG: hypothetical protein H0V17_22295 [Deltaproteobacteria bacterium]|nr:hypothetical protein [Deltaproteobacteria bacterium]
MKTLLAGVALVLVGCASGGRSFDPPDPEPDAKPPVDSMAEIPLDTAVTTPPDSAPPDSPAAPPDTMQPPDACVAVVTEKLANPALDLTPDGTGWTEVLIQNLEGGPYPIITADGLTPISAPNKAWMGGASGGDTTPAQGSVTDQLFQDITFPTDATTFVVSGMFAVGGIEVTTVVFDTFTLDVTELNGTPIENVLVLNNTTPSAAFVPFSKTLTSNLAGRTVRLRATSTNDVSDHTNFFLDSFSFKATFCPP